MAALRFISLACILLACSHSVLSGRRQYFPNQPPVTYMMAQNEHATAYSFTMGDRVFVSLFVITSKSVIVFEPVNDLFATALLASIRAITSRPITHIVYSHNHHDHIGGARVLKGKGTKIIAHSEACEYLKLFNANGAILVPDQCFNGKLYKFTVDRFQVELHYFGLNHGKGNIFPLLTSLRLLFVADIVGSQMLLFTIVPDYNLADVERTYKEILKLNFYKAVFTHSGKPDDVKIEGGTKKDVEAALRYLQDLNAEVGRMLAEGKYHPLDIPHNLRLDLYKNWWGYAEGWLEMNAWKSLLTNAIGPYPFYLQSSKKPQMPGKGQKGGRNDRKPGGDHDHPEHYEIVSHDY